MKTTLITATLAGLLCGCGTLGGEATKGGTIGQVQAMDDALLAKRGVPPEITAKVRKALGIIDARALPDAARVLPAGWTWKQDILDAEGKVVDVSKFRKGAPYVVPDGTDADNVVKPADIFPVEADNAAALLTGLLQAIKDDPSLLEPVDAPEGK